MASYNALLDSDSIEESPSITIGQPSTQNVRVSVNSDKSDPDETVTATESSPLLESSGLHEHHGTIFSSVFTLISTMVGGGILSLPFAFQQGGFILMSVALFVIFMASTHGGFLIINSKKYCQGRIKNVEDVANIAYGKIGKLLTQMQLVMSLFLCCVAYWILIVDQLQPIFDLTCPSSFWAKPIVIQSLAVLVIFPVTLLKSMRALQFTSALRNHGECSRPNHHQMTQDCHGGVVCVSFLSGIIVFTGAKGGLGGDLHRPNNPVKWWPDNLGGFFTAISISSLTFSCHFNILPMYSELRYQTRQNKRVILYTAMGFTYGLNVLVSLFGFMEFRKFTNQDITKNYPRDDVSINVGRCALALTLLLSFPLLVFPCRDIINRLIWKSSPTVLYLPESRLLLMLSNVTGTGPSRMTWFLETLLLVVTSHVLAYFIPQVTMVWGFVGSIGTSLMIYILPPAFYLRVRIHPPRPDLKQIAAWCLMVLGIVVLVIGTYQSVVNVIRPIQVPTALPPTS